MWWFLKNFMSEKNKGISLLDRVDDFYDIMTYRWQ